MFADSTEQQEGTAAAAAFPRDAAEELRGGGHTEHIINGMRQPCPGRRCHLGPKWSVRSHAWLQGSK